MIHKLYRYPEKGRKDGLMICVGRVEEIDGGFRVSAIYERVTLILNSFTEAEDYLLEKTQEGYTEFWDWR